MLDFLLQKGHVDYLPPKTRKDEWPKLCRTWLANVSKALTIIFFLTHLQLCNALENAAYLQLKKDARQSQKMRYFDKQNASILIAADVYDKIKAAVQVASKFNYFQS